MIPPRSGRQLRVAGYGYEAVVASVGASLRVLRFEGRDLVVPFESDEVRPGYRGTTLAPWPNRIVDGRYEFGGVQHQLALTEPERGQALHGLLSWAEFSDRLVASDRIMLTAIIEPQTGYPFRVEVETVFRLDEDGLHQTVTARNLGRDAAPWGTGPHPYLVAGAGRVDDWTLTLSASEVLTVTDDRLSPIEVEPVSRHPQWDFRTPHPIGKAGAPIADTYPGQALTRAVARANQQRREKIKRINVHGLRHTFAAVALSELKADTVLVSRALGHSRPSTTLNHYGHLAPRGLEALMGEMDGLRSPDGDQSAP